MSYLLAVYGRALGQLGRRDEAIAAAAAVAEQVIAPSDPELADYALGLAEAISAGGRVFEADAQRLRAREHLQDAIAAGTRPSSRAPELLARAARSTAAE